MGLGLGAGVWVGFRVRVRTSRTRSTPMARAHCATARLCVTTTRAPGRVRGRRGVRVRATARV